MSFALPWNWKVNVRTCIIFLKDEEFEKSVLLFIFLKCSITYLEYQGSTNAGIKLKILMGQWRQNQTKNFKQIYTSESDSNVSLFYLFEPSIQIWLYIPWFAFCIVSQKLLSPLITIEFELERTSSIYTFKSLIIELFRNLLMLWYD